MMRLRMHWNFRLLHRVLAGDTPYLHTFLLVIATLDCISREARKDGVWVFTAFTSGMDWAVSLLFYILRLTGLSVWLADACSEIMDILHCGTGFGIVIIVVRTMASVCCCMDGDVVYILEVCGDGV